MYEFIVYINTQHNVYNQELKYTYHSLLIQLTINMQKQNNYTDCNNTQKTQASHIHGGENNYLTPIYFIV